MDKKESAYLEQVFKDCCKLERKKELTPYSAGQGDMAIILLKKKRKPMKADKKEILKELTSLECMMQLNKTLISFQKLPIGNPRQIPQGKIYIKSKGAQWDGSQLLMYSFKVGILGSKNTTEILVDVNPFTGNITAFQKVPKKGGKKCS